jgi:hypothetical protein
LLPHGLFRVFIARAEQLPGAVRALAEVRREAIRFGMRHHPSQQIRLGRGAAAGAPSGVYPTLIAPWMWSHLL